MNNLFNQKLLIQKAQEEINLNDYSEKRKILNNWINSLEKGILAKSKEEEFQGEFLNDIFSLILGAVNKSSGKDEWNLQRETKTKIDGQKAVNTTEPKRVIKKLSQKGYHAEQLEGIRLTIPLPTDCTNIDNLKTCL